MKCVQLPYGDILVVAEAYTRSRMSRDYEGILNKVTADEGTKSEQKLCRWSISFVFLLLLLMFSFRQMNLFWIIEYIYWGFIDTYTCR